MSTAKEQMEAAWKLGYAARDYAKNAGRDIGVQEAIDKVFVPSGMVDVAKTNQAKNANPPQVILNSSYGLQYRQDQKDWIPFRHGPVPL